MRTLGQLMRRAWFRAAFAAVGLASLAGGVVFAQSVDNRNPFFVVVSGVQKAGVDADGDAQFDGTITAGSGNEVLTNADGTIKLVALEAGAAGDNDLLFFDSGTGWGPGVLSSLRLIDGSASTPTYGWASDPDSGDYLVSDGVLGRSVAGGLLERLSATGLELGIADLSRVPVILHGDATTNGGRLVIANPGSEDGTTEEWRIEADDTLKIGTPANAAILAVTASGTFITTDAPTMILSETGAPANEGNWWWRADGGDLKLTGLSDAFGSSFDVLSVTRTGTTLNNVTLGGTVVITTADVNGGAIDGTNIGASTRGTGAFTTLAANSTTTLAGATTVSGTLAATNSVTLSPANQAVTLSPTGTGTVTINPATAGTMNNVAIGGTTPATATFTGMTVANTAPAFTLSETDSSANNKLWSWLADGEQLRLTAFNDVFASQTAMLVDRTAEAIDRVQLRTGGSTRVDINGATTTVTSLVATTADVNGGTVDATNIGASTRGTGAFTTLAANSTTTLAGATTASSTLQSTGGFGINPTASGLTLTNDALTITNSTMLVSVLGQGGAADNLDEIIGGFDGQIIFLMTGDIFDAITIRHAQTPSEGGRTIFASTGADVAVPLLGITSLIRVGSEWRQWGSN